MDKALKKVTSVKHFPFFTKVSARLVEKRNVTFDCLLWTFQMGMQKSDLAPNNSFVPFVEQLLTIILFPYQLRQSLHVLILLHVNVMGIHSVRSYFCWSVWT